MRKIEQLACEAFLNREDFKRDNTEVTAEGDYMVMYLHHHPIARRDFANPNLGQFLVVSLCGWDTNTTRSRIHALLKSLDIKGGCGRHKGQTMLLGQPWNGESALINLATETWEQLK